MPAPDSLVEATVARPADQPLSPLVRFSPYLGAVALTIAVSLFRLAIDPLAKERYVYVPYFFAVVFSAWKFGYRPALLTMTLGAAGAMFLFHAPRNSWSIAPEAGLGLAMYLGVSYMVIALNESTRRAQRRAEDALAGVLQKQRELAVANEALRQSEDHNQRMIEALQASEHLYRAIGESIDYGVWVCDANGRNLYVSDSFLKLLGMTQDEFADFGWTKAFDPEEGQATADAWRECVRQGALWDREIRMRSTDGTWHSILSRGVPIRTEQGEIVRWAGIHLDISRMKRIENELREADRRKDEFLAMLAHELRNPLAPLSNSLDLLWLSEELTPNVEQIARIMERQVKLMVRLVDDLLEVSRISRGKIELRKESVDLASVLRTALETSRPLIAASAHQLALSLPTEPIPLEADPVRLAQVIANLLNNAAKYTEPGGQIWLSARREGAEAVISVRDNGIGIAAELLPRVFEIFAQGDRSLSRSQGGLGIGLTLARSMVTLHGGRIEAASPGPGQGSEFTVRLPLAPQSLHAAPARETESALPARDESHLAKRRILVVDDARASAYILGQLLTRMGQDVRTTDTGASALELVQSESPEVVFSDIAMPGMDGYELARSLRRMPRAESKRLVLVALTGYGQDGDRQRALDAGFDHHLIKPVSLEALEKLLGAIDAAPLSAASESRPG